MTTNLMYNRYPGPSQFRTSDLLSCFNIKVLIKLEMSCFVKYQRRLIVKLRQRGAEASIDS